MKRHLIWIGMAICFLWFLALDASIGYSQVRPVPTSPPASIISSENYIRSDRLGITFISSADSPDTAERYRNALVLGAGWNRWPLYWHSVEPTQGEFDWSAYDELVMQDIGHGLQINAILLGNPEFYRDGSRIAGLNAPIFADGTNTPGAGKTINPENPWANFVFQAVQRYMPGGILAQQQGWSPEQGVTVWEVWNEPDHKPFWAASIQDYARLLQISYIVAHLADPDTTIMFGGLLFSTDNNWLAQVLLVYSDDPLREDYNWYMDAVAIHNYHYPWRSGWLALFVRQTLRAYEQSRPIWLNESGVPVWDDYPGPVWSSTPGERATRATAEQQAWFFIQSSAYAWAEGVDVVFFHQLYDDCGDQAPGTNFPPHSGELCSAGNACFGDAFGLYRNQGSSICFSQHPFPNTARPVAAAYKLMADVFGTQPFSGGDVELVQEKQVAVVSFARPNTGERILVIWNRTFDPVTVEVQATGSGAQLYRLDGITNIIPNPDGNYRFDLLPAVNDYFPFLEDDDLTAIGGPPMILIESFGDEPITVVENTPLEFSPASGTPRGTALPAIALPSPMPPTVSPSDDQIPPTTSVEALPPVSPPTFTLRWQGVDNSGIDRYFVWVRVNEGEWTPWLDTERTEALYTGESGNLYEFAVWAVDLAGNWSTNVAVDPQTSTRVE